jgi:hypothetical protein
MSLLTKADGSAFDSDSLSMWFASAIDEAGLPDACVMHGLRKNGGEDACRGGYSTHEIASITGHAALTEIERYTKAANQKKLATAAIHKLERNAKRTASGRRTPSQSGKQRAGD